MTKKRIQSMNNGKKAPIMPKATAIWLIDNTVLTFRQIADFCGIHELEVKGIADGEVSNNIMGLDPVASGQLTKEELVRCTSNPNAALQLSSSVADAFIGNQKKKQKYTPIARRQDKPDAVYWILKNYPNIHDSQIIKLLGTTKMTIAAIRDRSHWNMKNIRPRDPVLLGICTQTELDKVVSNSSIQEV